MTTIPKIIHQIWIGQAPPPQEWMDTCRRMNPSWEYRLWTDANLPHDFVNRHHIEAMAVHQPHYPEAGQADIIRYELLYRYGGFFVDADSEFIRPLDDHLTRNDSFCCYESEALRGDLLANGYLAATPGNALMRLMIEELNAKETLVDDFPWKVTGPLFLTQTVKKYHYDRLTVYPSHYFIPRHFSSRKSYVGQGEVYCIQHWGSTLASDRVKRTRSLEINAEGEKKFAADDIDGALDCFQRALTIDNAVADVYNNLAVVLWTQGRLNDALVEIERALILEPEHEDARYNLAAFEKDITDRPDQNPPAFKEV